MHTPWDEQVERLEIAVGPHTFDALAAGPDDGRLVLLLHGFPEFADSWYAVLPALAEAGYRAVAVDQRGYSPRARPEEVSAYGVDLLVADVLGFADALGADDFHLVAHDWGGLVAWAVAAAHPDRVRTLSVLATPHPSALVKALDGPGGQAQRERSKYVGLFRAPEHAAEQALLADGAAPLRGVYRGALPEWLLESNLRRLTEPGALTAGLNWYRATEKGLLVEAGPVAVPTLYVWGTEDQALGIEAAVLTEEFVTGAYRFLPLTGASHWLPEADAARLLPALLEHLAKN
ncbi:alpha/beta fold hydrolase [Kitasatospora sp. McL0602]|uniref:alpha/beta fold hydrolase n=1 Tax=Kitasatospora sp. McL0602 TaxID=3439530 RepID=UPI003F8B8C89